MNKLFVAVLGAGVALAYATPVMAAVAVPAPVMGTGLGGLVVLGVAGAGYLLLRLRRRD